MSKHRNEYNIKKIGSVLLAGIVFYTIAAFPSYAQSEELKDYVYQNTDFVPIEYDFDISDMVYYNEYLQTIQDVPAILENVVVDLSTVSVKDGESIIQNAEKDGNSILLEMDREYSWDIHLTHKGKGYLYVTYVPAENNTSTITREIVINGKSPFLESKAITFDRQYKDDGAIITGPSGDDIRPQTSEVFEWSTTALYDSGGLYELPLEFIFEQGKNTITIANGNGQMKIKEIKLAVPKKVVSYSEYTAGYQDIDVKLQQPIAWEAESSATRNDPSIRPVCDLDPITTPYANGDYRLNVLGDSRWSRGNQWAQWEFQVEKSGIYQLYFRGAQWYNDGRSSYRQITIDGVVPFAELLSYEIPYSNKWSNVAIADKNGVPYGIYLEKGKHTIRLTTKIGYMSTISNRLERVSLLMSDILRNVLKVTGYDIDPNYRYELEVKAPEVVEGLSKVLNEVNGMLDSIEASGNKPSIYYSLNTAKKLLEATTENPDQITLKYDELSALQSNFGTWMDDIRSNALGVDRWYVCTDNLTPPKATAGFFQGLVGSFKVFLKSFFKDYDTLSGTSGGSKTIQAWVSLGREWTEAMRDIIDNEFTPKYGINVKLNTFPSGQLNAGSANALMLAVNAGTAPDVAIGVSASSVGEFAMRDVVVDLQKKENFNKFSKWFVSNAFVPFTYQNGVYGIPCTQDFTVLYYRKDILKNLGFGIPQTWNDIYMMLAKLNANGYSFYYPPNPAPFIFQHGADYYSEDLKKSGLDDSRFLEAFEEYTELFINYRVPTAANFFNRFRSGEMPIGVGGYDMYISLSTAAPELRNRWGMYLLPGFRKEDGSIDRSVNSGASTANVILNGSEYKDESWEFLQWFMSEETQVEYGRLVESILGLGARWNSANLAAFKKLPWSTEEINVITEQWKFNREIPIVPGSYATTRYLNFAWTDIVISGKDVRTTLEEAAQNINKQMDKKYAEFSRMTNKTN